MLLPPTARPRTGLWRALYQRFAHLIHELGKFGVVGAICYVIDIAIFNLWLGWVNEPISAKTVSTIAAASVAFVGNRFWTWRDRERSSLRREYTLYFSFNLVGLLISVACLWISHYGLGSIWPSVFATRLADNISGNLIGVVLASLFRFWAYRRYVFRPVVPELSRPVTTTSTRR
ncbi:MAG TPA: GtrA family protein [Micromonosporaceae bacterium]